MLKTVSAGFGYTALQGIAAQAAANETKEIKCSVLIYAENISMRLRF